MAPQSQLAEVVRRTVRAEPHVLAIYLFGSRASDQARDGSDVDLGVLYDTRQSLETTLALEQALEVALGRAVDLVDLGRASAFLALDVVRGERLFCRDEDVVDRFELYVLRRAGDLLPFERQRQQLLLATRR